MKILIVTSGIPPFVGGAENVAWDIANELKKYFMVHVLTLGKKEQEYVENGLNIKSIKWIRPLTLYYELFKKKVTGFIDENSIDLVNIHGTLPFGFTLRNKRVLVVITCHGMERIPKGIKRIVNVPRQELIRISLHSANAVTAPGLTYSRFLKSFYNTEVHRIPNGVYLKDFKNLNLKRRDKSVLFVGRYIALKGIRTVIDVANELKDIQFFFAGEGPMKKNITLLNTVDLGKLHRDELVKTYNKIPVCLFPSEVENFPAVCLEAMACGCVVIASKPGFGDIIDSGNNGIIIENNSVEAYINEIRNLFNDEKVLKKLSRNAISKSKEYDVTRIGNLYRELFLSLQLMRNGPSFSVSKTFMFSSTQCYMLLRIVKNEYPSIF